METLCIINLALIIALSVIIALMWKRQRAFEKAVCQFAEQISSAPGKFKKGLLIGFGVIAVIEVIRKLMGGSNDELSE
jgi:hypothetical protein